MADFGNHETGIDDPLPRLSDLYKNAAEDPAENSRFREWFYQPLRRDKVLATICVTALNGETSRIAIKGSETVQDVKKRAALRLGTPLHECMLVYDGKELEDDLKPNWLEIQDGPSLKLVPRSGNDVKDSVKKLYKNARKVIENLVKWFPDLLGVNFRKLTERDLSTISQAIGEGWQHLGYQLGLSTVDLEHISDGNTSMVMKIYYMLSKWRLQNTAEATVSKLRLAMENCSKVTFDWTIVKRGFAGI